MNILVTGCAGFIGTNLCEALLQQNHNVFGVDNFSTGQSDNLKILKEYPNFTYWIADLNDKHFLRWLLTRTQNELSFDQIYHMASPASPPKYNNLPFETIYVNTRVTEKLLEKARIDNASFLFASTSEVYGQPEIIPQSEEYNGNVTTTGPRAIYDESKRLAETITYEYYRRYGVDVKIPRIHNTYGPNMSLSDGRVVTNFIKQAINNEEYTIYGDGSQFRCLTYITDMVAALIKLMNSEYHKPINLGSNEPISVKEIALKINQVFDKKIRTMPTYQFPHKFYPLPTDDPVRRLPDTSKAKEILGWQPKVSLEDGLYITIKHFVIQQVGRTPAP